MIRRRKSEDRSHHLTDAPLHHIVVPQPRDLALQLHLRVEPGDELLRLDVHPGVIDAVPGHRALQQLLLVGGAALVVAHDLGVVGAAVPVVAGRSVLVAAQGVGEEVPVAHVAQPGRVGHSRRDAGDEAEHARGRRAEPERRRLVDGVLALAVAEPFAAPLVANDAVAARPEHGLPQQPPRPRPDRRLLHLPCVLKLAKLSKSKNTSER
jgi:hypothetical protein